MDYLVLIRVTAVLQARCGGCVLRRFRQQSAHRYQLLFEDERGRTVPVAVSLKPDLPWLGIPPASTERPLWSPSPFAAACTEALEGRPLIGVARVGRDRVVAFDFGGGGRLVAEMATHGANLVLVAADGATRGSAHHPRSAANRLLAGGPYAPPSPPRHPARADDLDAAAVDRVIAEAVREGESSFEALRRRVFGVGTQGAFLVLAESRAANRTPGEVLASRIEALLEGRLDPVIEGPIDPWDASSQGRLDPEVLRLLPWEPDAPAPGRAFFRRKDAAGTAGLWHESLERGAWVHERARTLRSILEGERRRATDALRNAVSDVASFEDPERWRSWGESLLAGLSTARRVGDRVIVADAHDPSGREIAIPAAPALPLHAVADDLFRRHRRSKRGIEIARARVATLEGRRDRLDALAAELDRLGPGREAEVEALLVPGLRAMGLAVALEAGTRAQRVARRAVLPRLEGVRVVASEDGLEILVGRTGKDNDRLTFKVAGPDDLWLHARGVSGAHVIVRGVPRGKRPPERTLAEAAALAAWFSDARDATTVDVQWTRRKYVRRSRSGPSGAVLVKRFETIRVAPRPPRGSE